MFTSVEEEDRPSFHFPSNDFHGSEVPLLTVKDLGDSSFRGRQERILSSRQTVQPSRRSSVTIDRLRFSELQIHGRGLEQATILARLNKVARATSSAEGGTVGESKPIKQMVLISGFSGTGKTTLAMTLQQPVLRVGGVFSMGKYDLQHQSEPYLGFVSAFEAIYSQISDSIQNKCRNNRDLFHEDLCSDIGNDVKLLSCIAPSIVKFMGNNVAPASDADQDSDEFGAAQGRQEAKAKLHFIVRQLCRILCKHYAPVVIALDDLQWADLASLELIEDLVSDRTNCHLMLVGLYRSDEVENDSLLAKTLPVLHSKTAQGLLETTALSLGSIDVADVNGIIMDLLSLDSSAATMELATICHRRTQGNAFFVISFLRMLHDKGLLKYNFGAMKWIWDISTIEQGTSATTNVVALTQRKMECLSKRHQRLLALAACLGNVFEKQKFSVAASGLGLAEKSDSNETATASEFLPLATSEGYLEGPLDESHQYRWVHDSIHEAALSLIPETEIVKFKYDVGKGLLSALAGKELDKCLFVVVGLLNPYALEVGDLNDQDKEILASLNLAAARRSMKSASFRSTSSFAKIGISLLPKKHWESHQRLSMKLFTIACEAEAYLVNEEAMNFYGSELIRQESISLFDKMRVYRAKLSFLGLGTANRAHEAVELCLDVLHQLGCTLPKTEMMKTLKLILALMKHKRDLPKRTADEVASLPLLTSRRLLEIDSILNELTLFAYTAGNMILSGLCTMKQTSITLKHGMHDDAYNGFCSLAPFFMVAFGDLQATDQVAQYSLLLKERAYGKKDVVRFCLMQASFSMPWKRPWTTIINVLTDGFESGIREGELRNAYFCIAAALTVSFFRGINLDKLRHDIQKTLQYSSDLTPGIPMKDILILEHCITMLLDTSLSSGTDHPLVSQYTESAKNEEFTLALLYVYQGYIYYAQGYFEKCAALAETTGILLDRLLSHYTNLPVLYHQAFCLYASAQVCSNRMRRHKLKSLAIKRHKILNGWARQGCCNAIHYVAILDAEQTILNQGKAAKLVEDLYQKAIVLTVRGGFVQDAAIANERLAGFFAKQGDQAEAARRYEQSILYYEEWGFKSKAEQLRRKTNGLV